MSGRWIFWDQAFYTVGGGTSQSSRRVRDGFPGPAQGSDWGIRPTYGACVRRGPKNTRTPSLCQREFFA
jgi:hypothetical protein